MTGAENLRATPILDTGHPAVRDLAQRAVDLPTAHALVTDAVRAAYALDERRPASRTLGAGRGSCSQRFAVLEAVARVRGTPTRTHGLAVAGTFWHRRFPRWRRFVPDVVLLAWPQFHVDGRWQPVQDLLAPGCTTGCGPRFANDGPETLFDAAARPAAVDLAPWLRADLGTFPDRDTFFAVHGQTLGAPLRQVAQVVLARS